MFQVDKYHPVQGTNKFQTVSFPITKAVAVDFGAQTTANATVNLCTIPKGSVVLGFAVRITETLASTNAATVQFGFTGKPMLSTALGSGVAVAGYIAHPLGFTSNTAAACPPYVLTADDTFDIILAVDPPSAGKADCFITYVPIPTGDINTADFKSVICT
jgi:hypothetical protein